MANRPRFHSFSRSKTVKAQLRLDPASLDDFNRQLRRLEDVVRLDVMKRALGAGGSMIQRAAKSRAPGPHIAMKVMDGTALARGWRSASAQGVKSDALYAAIGPDKAHWYYRFAETGTSDHGVRNKKNGRYRGRTTTRFQQGLRRQGVYIRKARKMQVGKRLSGSTRPAMRLKIDGQYLFRRRVRGQAAKPFLKPAVDSQRTNTIKAMRYVLQNEINQVLR